MNLCKTCFKPEWACICGDVQSIAIKTQVLILQHPQEPGEYLGTASLLAAALPDATLKVGLSWPNLSKAWGKPAEQKNWGVLFLGTAKTSHAKSSQNAVSLMDRKGNPLSDSMAQLRGLSGIVALDGNWRQAKTLWWRNSWLLKLKRIVLSPTSPSLYGRQRREPRRESLSTLEAVALTLSAIEQRPEIEKTLLDLFSAFLKKVSSEGMPPACGK